MSYLELSDVEIQQIREDPENQDWKFISYNYVLSEEFIKEFFDRFNDSFGTLLTYQKITESFLYSIKDQIIGIKWSYLSMNNLSENFIRDFEDKLYWFFISKYLYLCIKILIMNTYIKYKREHKTVTEEELQNYFDKYIIEGWEIINYQEEKHKYRDGDLTS